MAFISIFIRHLNCFWSKNILLLIICDLVMCTCFFDITEEEGRTCSHTESLSNAWQIKPSPLKVVLYRLAI